MDGSDCVWFKVFAAPEDPMPEGLDNALTWLGNNAEEGGAYAITLKADEAIAPRTLSYGGKNVSITIEGDAAERIVSLSAAGSLFIVANGITLALGSNAILQRRSDNTASLINVNSGGTLVMNTGSKISGNTSSYGGGVYVGSDNNTIFTMDGGAISGNSATSRGGGVFADNNRTFTMNGGVISGNSGTRGGGVYIDTNGVFVKQSNSIIYGSNAGSSQKNTATAGDAYGHAVYVNSGSKKRNATAGAEIRLNSAVSGSAGGWED
jgi:hypothetical protein